MHLMIYAKDGLVDSTLYTILLKSRAFLIVIAITFSNGYLSIILYSRFIGPKLDVWHSC